jgi:hypothetical protein
MKIKHNKKRNVGIVFEQLNQEISSSIINSDKNRKNLCLKIMNENFCVDSELLKELRLFLSLSTVKVTNDSLIERILHESKNQAGLIDAGKLSKQKSKLIKEINENLGQDFFDQKIDNYTSLATIHVLLESWRTKGNQQQNYFLEDKLITELKGIPKSAESNKEIPIGLNKLVLEMAKKRFFEKYKNLSKNQLEILFEFVSKEDKTPLFEKYEKIRLKAIKEIKNFLIKEEKSDFFKSEMELAKLKIQEMNFMSKDIDDKEKLQRAIILVKLHEDLTNE